MKRLIILMLIVMPLLADAQLFGVTGYIAGGYSKPDGYYMEGGAATTYIKSKSIGGLRFGVAYHETTYKAGAVDTFPYAVDWVPGIGKWKVSTIQYSVLLDPFPKTPGKINFSFAFGFAGAASSAKGFNNRLGKYVGDRQDAGHTIFPKISAGIGFAGVLATIDILIPTQYRAQYAPFNIGVVFYPKLLVDTIRKPAKDSQ